MNLYRIEYQIRSTGQNLICLSVGTDQEDIIKDITSVVGDITVLSLYSVTEVHRISGSIRTQIIQNSLKTETRSRIGRPRKFDMVGV
jgi:hypothetical protein